MLRISLHVVVCAALLLWRAAPGTAQLLDVDGNGQVDVATDITYIARSVLGLPPVPPGFRMLAPTIPSDSVITTRINQINSAAFTKIFEMAPYVFPFQISLAPGDCTTSGLSASGVLPTDHAVVTKPFVPFQRVSIQVETGTDDLDFEICNFGTATGYGTVQLNGLQFNILVVR